MIERRGAARENRHTRGGIRTYSLNPFARRWLARSLARSLVRLPYMLVLISSPGVYTANESRVYEASRRLKNSITTRLVSFRGPNAAGGGQRDQRAGGRIQNYFPPRIAFARCGDRLVPRGIHREARMGPRCRPRKVWWSELISAEC